MHPYQVLSAGPYPNSSLSAGQIADLAVYQEMSMEPTLILEIVAAREPRHADTAETAETASLPQQPGTRELEHERPERTAA